MANNSGTSNLYTIVLCASECVLKVHVLTCQNAVIIFKLLCHCNVLYSADTTQSLNSFACRTILETASRSGANFSVKNIIFHVH